MNKLPSITDEIRQAGKKLDLNLRPRLELDDAAIEANSRSIGERYGSNTQISSADPVRPATRPAPTLGDGATHERAVRLPRLPGQGTGGPGGGGG
ncbi:hypothetical protein ACFQU7_41255 [Pseudoroseomonas wenyumeiae]